MPNHVTNIMIVKGSPEKVKELFDKVIVDTDTENDLAVKKAFDFNTFAPIPDALKHTTSPPNIVSEKEYQRILKERIDKLVNEEEIPFYDSGLPITKKMSAEYMEKYGHNDWYSWKIANWGTKWGAYNLYIADDFVASEESTISFQTAWSTPFKAIKLLSVAFPDVEITIRYADEDFGYNVGEYTFEGGECTSQNVPEGGSIEALKLAMDIEYCDEFNFLDFEGLDEEEFNTEVKRHSYHYNLLEIAFEEEQVSYLPIVDTYLLEKAIKSENFKYAEELRKAIEETKEEE